MHDKNWLKFYKFFEAVSQKSLNLRLRWFSLEFSMYLQSFDLAFSFGYIEISNYRFPWPYQSEEKQRFSDVFRGCK